jgi:predicted DCC family thiol-disulfide oxidoreductase YuxK
MELNSSFLLTVYYDGLCLLCSTEIDHYKKQSGSEKINFVDITSAHFDAVKENLDPYAVHKILHSRKNSGQLLVKLDAFRAIWEILPKYKWLYRLSEKKVIRKLMDLGYSIFSYLRPFLPKKKNSSCESSPYCSIQEKNR